MSLEIAILSEQTWERSTIEQMGLARSIDYIGMNSDCHSDIYVKSYYLPTYLFIKKNTNTYYVLTIIWKTKLYITSIMVQGVPS